MLLHVSACKQEEAKLIVLLHAGNQPGMIHYTSGGSSMPRLIFILLLLESSRLLLLCECAGAA